MIAMNIMYPNDGKSFFDKQYFVDTHIPMTRKLWAPYLKSSTYDFGISGLDPKSKPDFILVVRLVFESMEDVEKAIKISKPLFEDVPKFTDIEPIDQFSEIFD